MTSRRRTRCPPSARYVLGFAFTGTFVPQCINQRNGHVTFTGTSTPSSPRFLPFKSRRVIATCSAANAHDINAMAVEARTIAWARIVVCGLGLCPFAEPVLDSNTVRVFVWHADDESAVKDAVATEISLLISTDPAQLSTSLLVLPRFARDDFLRFHELCGELEDSIERNELLVDEVMLACFHPRHQWEDSHDSEDAINFDKRAPYPIINFLRAPVVDQYVHEGKTQRILERNQSTLERMGSDRLKDLHRSLWWDETSE